MSGTSLRQIRAQWLFAAGHPTSAVVPFFPLS